MSQHQPHQGTTTEGMSFPTKWKGKKNRKAQHHTAHSLAFPFQRKAGQEITKEQMTGKKSIKEDARSPLSSKGHRQICSNLEDYLSLKPDPCHKSRLYFMLQWLPVSLAYLSRSWKWFGPAADQPQRARKAGENFDNDFESDIFLLYTVNKAAR